MGLFTHSLIRQILTEKLQVFGTIGTRIFLYFIKIRENTILTVFMCNKRHIKLGYRLPEIRYGLRSLIPGKPPYPTPDLKFGMWHYRPATAYAHPCINPSAVFTFPVIHKLIQVPYLIACRFISGR